MEKSLVFQNVKTVTKININQIILLIIIINSIQVNFIPMGICLFVFLFQYFEFL